MHESLVATLNQWVTIEKKSVPNAFGETTPTVIGPLRARLDTSRTRATLPEGEEVTAEGTLFLDGRSLYIGQVEAGDVVVFTATAKRRAIRVLEPFYDLDNPPIDHWELVLG